MGETRLPCFGCLRSKHPRSYSAFSVAGAGTVGATGSVGATGGLTSGARGKSAGASNFWCSETFARPIPELSDVGVTLRVGALGDLLAEAD